MNIGFFLPNSRDYEDRIRLLMALSNHVESVTLFLGINDGRVDGADLERFSVCEVGFIRGFKLVNLVKSMLAVRAVYLAKGLDVVHDTSGNLILFFILARVRKFSCLLVSSFFTLERWRIENVWKPAGYSTFSLVTNLTTARMFLGSWFQGMISKLADRVVLQAPGLIGRVTKYCDIDPQDVSVLTNNVDTCYWRPVGNHSPTDGFSPKKLLYVGGLDHTRGLIPVLNTLHMCKKSGLNLHLTLVAKPGMMSESDIRSLVENLGLSEEVVFKNGLTRQHMRNTYNESDILIYQTINDGSPRVVLEAISCGLPVIASTHPGIDILDPKKEYILFTEFGDTEEMYRLIKSVLSDHGPETSISVKGREKILKCFSTEAVAQDYARFYNEFAVGFRR